MERNDRWLTLGSHSTRALSPSASNANAGPETAALWASRLFGFYRASEANDAETFIAGATAILARYPESVVRRVCSPTGLPASNKWLPSLAEISEACHVHMQPILAEEARQYRRSHTAMVLARAEAIGDAERQRVKDGFAKLAGNREIDRAAVRRSAEAKLVELTEAYKTPPAINTKSMADYLAGMREQIRAAMAAE